MPTPPLPDWIRRADVPGYETAHRLCPDEPHLYGTEDLFGEWDGEVLLLAKDYGPSWLLRKRMKRPDLRPYGYESKMRANVRLRQLVAPIVGVRFLYGSALANLLRKDDRVSGALPNRNQAVEYGTRVTRWVIEHMPRLTWIVCMGEESWEVACKAEGRTWREGEWRERRGKGEPLGRLVAAFHPSARVKIEQMAPPWNSLREWAALGERRGPRSPARGGRQPHS